MAVAIAAAATSNHHSLNVFSKDVNNPSLNSIYSWNTLQWKRKRRKKKKKRKIRYRSLSSSIGMENQTMADAKPKNFPSPNKAKILLGMKVNKQRIDLSVSCTIVKLNHNLFVCLFFLYSLLLLLLSFSKMMCASGTNVMKREREKKSFN